MTIGPIYQFTVTGVPKPQGSKRAFVVQAKGEKPRAVVVDSNKGPMRDWRVDVTVEAARQRELMCAPPLTGPVSVLLTFWLPRPKSAPKSRVFHSVRPDLDKLTRAVFDSITAAGLWHDDSQVSELTTQKIYPEPSHVTGVQIHIHALREGRL